MSNLKRLSEAACAGPWSYRPDNYDDWGMIRGGEIKDTEIGDIRPPVALSKSLWGDSDYEAHRRSNTDPMEANGKFIVALVNAYRDGRLTEKS